MHRQPIVSCVAGFCLLGSFAGALRTLAQDPPPRARQFCDPVETKVCRDNVFKITFDNANDSVFQYETFTQGEPIDVTVYLDVKVGAIQGWSYGVASDDTFLTLTEVTTKNTVSAPASEGGLVSGGFVVADRESIQTCENEEPPTCRNPIDTSGGFICATILSFMESKHLPPGDNALARAKYALKADAGPNGSLIRFSTRIKKKNSPPVDLNITDDGVSAQPKTLIDGWVKLVGEALIESCDNGKDDDQDGKVDCADSDCRDDFACKPKPEVCDNGKDDDLDGFADCDDRDCSRFPACLPPPEVCDNGKDDDLDGRIDCEDFDCATFPRCIRESCLNGVDDDQDGKIDCEDEECKDAIICRIEICDNGIDDNADAMTDCYDPDCKAFPACEPKPEICDNKKDDDFDAKTDCGDPDCKTFEACVPKPEICDNRIDDDLDGRTDCRDRDCDSAAVCAPGPEVCDDCFDNDRDGKMDCEDSDCATHPHCSPRPEVCDNLIDDDDDGLVDGNDPDCPGPRAQLGLSSCAEYALYFGPHATDEDFAAPRGGFLISMRNRSPVHAVRLCMERSREGDAAVYKFTEATGFAAEEPGSVFVFNDYKSFQAPVTPNHVITLADEAIVSVERGSATQNLAGWDFLASKIEAPNVEGLCLTLEYVVDINLSAPHGVIPPTRSGPSCALNELFKVVTAPLAASFRRGDVDGTLGLGISDAVLIIKHLVANARPPRDCRDALDVDDNGLINITDPIVVLRYLFQDGPGPAEPFGACGFDSTPEAFPIGCAEASCE